MRKALAQRGALVFGPILLLLAIVATVPGYKPWAALVIFCGAFGVLVLITSTRGDRKLLVQLGKADAPWLGNYAVSLPIQAATAPEDAVQVARQALTALGAWDVERLNEGTVVGWTGSILTNLPRQQAYELAVVVSGQPNGQTQILCCARPRFMLALLGASMCQEWAGRIQQAVLARL